MFKGLQKAKDAMSDAASTVTDAVGNASTAVGNAAGTAITSTQRAAINTAIDAMEIAMEELNKRDKIESSTVGVEVSLGGLLSLNMSASFKKSDGDNGE